MIGPYVMVSPILEQGAVVTRAEFPGPQSWYNILDGQFIASDKSYELTENETVSVKVRSCVLLKLFLENFDESKKMSKSYYLFL